MVDEISVSNNAFVKANLIITYDYNVGNEIVIALGSGACENICSRQV